MGSVKEKNKIVIQTNRNAFDKHASSHNKDGFDPVSVADLQSDGSDNEVLTADGSGGLYWAERGTVGGVESLSGLIIDTDKDWNGYNITNFGSGNYDIEDELGNIVTTINNMGGITNISAMKLGESFPAGHTTNRLFFKPDSGILYDDGSDWNNISFVDHNDMELTSYDHHHPERDSGTDIQMTPFIEYAGDLDAQPIMAISLEPDERLQVWRLGYEKTDGTHGNVTIDVYDDTNDEVIYSTTDNDSSIGELPALAYSEYGVDIKVRLHTSTGTPVTLSVNYGFKLNG